LAKTGGALVKLRRRRRGATGVGLYVQVAYIWSSQQQKILKKKSLLDMLYGGYPNWII